MSEGAREGGRERASERAQNRNQVFGALTTQTTIILVGPRANALEVTTYDKLTLPYLCLPPTPQAVKALKNNSNDIVNAIMVSGESLGDLQYVHQLPVGGV